MNETHIRGNLSDATKIFGIYRCHCQLHTIQIKSHVTAFAVGVSEKDYKMPNAFDNRTFVALSSIQLCFITQIMHPSEDKDPIKIHSVCGEHASERHKKAVAPAAAGAKNE